MGEKCQVPEGREDSRLCPNCLGGENRSPAKRSHGVELPLQQHHSPRGPETRAHTWAWKQPTVTMIHRMAQPGRTHSAQQLLLADSQVPRLPLPQGYLISIRTPTPALLFNSSPALSECHLHALFPRSSRCRKQRIQNHSPPCLKCFIQQDLLSNHSTDSRRTQ